MSETLYTVTREMAEELAGRAITDEEAARIRIAIEFSTISECVSDAVFQVCEPPFTAFSTFPVPDGYRTVEHDDGTVHAINISEMKPGTQPWRNAPVCGRASGVSSDEGGEESWEEKLPEIDCIECISILA